MNRNVQMDLLKALVTECLSAAAEEIIRIVQRAIVDHEEDRHHGQMDVDEETPSDKQTDDATSDSKPHPSVNHIELDSDTENSEAPPDCDRPQNVLKLFSCPVCCSGFSSKKAMTRHMKKHSEGGALSYQCQFCDQRFCNSLELLAHARTHEGMELGQSQDGGQSSDRGNGSGLKLAAEETKKEEDEGGQSAMKKATARHMKKHPEGGASSYQCQFCDKRFCDSLEFIAHARTHEGRELGQSQDGGQSSDRGNGSGLKLAAEETKTEEEDDEGGQSAIKILPLPVPSYHQTDFDQESLQPLCLFHIQRGSDNNKDAQTLLSVDQIKTEPPEPEPAFEQNSGLFVAEDAGAEPSVLMGKSSELILQLEVGTAQKPYKCPCCSKCFSLTKTLLRHMKIHSEDKVYRCRLCGRRFCQKSDLVNHTRVHTGEKPYRCQECHKSFAQKGNLVVHMRTHMVENPCP